MLNIEQKLDQVNSEYLFIDVVILRKYLERENILFSEEKKNGKEKEENISGRKRRKLLDEEKNCRGEGKGLTSLEKTPTNRQGEYS